MHRRNRARAALIACYAVIIGLFTGSNSKVVDVYADDPNETTQPAAIKSDLPASGSPSSKDPLYEAILKEIRGGRSPIAPEASEPKAFANQPFQQLSSNDWDAISKLALAAALLTKESEKFNAPDEAFEVEKRHSAARSIQQILVLMLSGETKK